MISSCTDTATRNQARRQRKRAGMGARASALHNSSADILPLCETEFNFKDYQGHRNISKRCLHRVASQHHAEPAGGCHRAHASLLPMHTTKAWGKGWYTHLLWSGGHGCLPPPNHSSEPGHTCPEEPWRGGSQAMGNGSAATGPPGTSGEPWEGGLAIGFAGISREQDPSALLAPLPARSLRNR